MPEETTSVLEPRGAPEDTAVPAAPLDLNASIEQARLAYEVSKTAAAAPEAAPAGTEPEAEAASGEPAAGPIGDEPVQDAAPEPGDQEDEKPLTRKQAGRLYQEAIEKYESERAAKAELEQQLAARQSEEQALLTDVQTILGGSTERLATLRTQHRELATKGLRGDYEAAEQALELQPQIDQIEAAQQAHLKLYRFVELQQRAALQQHYDAARTLPGVDPAVLDRVPTLADAFRHVHEAATALAQTRHKAEITKLEADFEARQARLAGRALPTPGSGGRSTGGQPAGTPLYGPDGLPTPEARAAFERGQLNPSALGRR